MKVKKEHYHDDPENVYHTEQRNLLDMKISTIEKLMEHLDKLF